MARVSGGIRAQPGPHLGVRVRRGLRLRELAVCGAGKPNCLARQPLRHAQRRGRAPKLVVVIPSQLMLKATGVWVHRQGAASSAGVR